MTINNGLEPLHNSAPPLNKAIKKVNGIDHSKKGKCRFYLNI